MTENDPDWSVFWARGASRTAPPDGSNLWVGKTVAEDTDTSRADEVLGVGQSPPYSYGFSPAFDSAPQVALVSQAGMDGGNGGWAVLYGASPTSASGLALAVDEDQVKDDERVHTDEQVAYLVFEEALVYPAAQPD